MYGQNRAMNRLRPSYAEREAVHDLLSQSFANGRLDFAEFEARVDLVPQAATVSELLQLVDGLPAGSLEFAEQTNPPVPAEPDAPPSWTRRGVLAAAGLAVGFAVSGGFTRAFAQVSDEAPISPPPPVPQRPALPDQFAPGEFETSLQRITDEGYTTFTRLTVHPHIVTAVALAPDRPEVTDRITITNSGFETEPYNELTSSDIPFTLDDVDVSLLPAYLAHAPVLLGGTKVTHVIIEVDSTEPATVIVRVYVEGDEYGAGGGYVQWSGDGQTLLRIAR